MELRRVLRCEADFRNWLFSKKNITDRVCSDYVSRCKRVQKELGVDLYCIDINDNNYHLLINNIKNYANNYAKNINSAYALSGSLCLAVNCYMEFLHGHTFKDNFRKNYHRYNLTEN
jgi:hypothetical protein